MSITITITDPTPEQLAALFGRAPKEAIEAAEGNAAAKKGTKASSPPADTQESGSKTSDSGQTATTDASPSDVPDLEAVKAAAQKLVNASSREALAELLETFAAKNLSSIPEGKRAAFIEQCENKAK